MTPARAGVIDAASFVSSFLLAFLAGALFLVIGQQPTRGPAESFVTLFLGTVTRGGFWALAAALVVAYPLWCLLRSRRWSAFNAGAILTIAALTLAAVGTAAASAVSPDQGLTVLRGIMVGIVAVWCTVGGCIIYQHLGLRFVRTICSLGLVVLLVTVVGLFAA